MKIDQKILKILFKNKNDGDYHVLLKSLEIPYDKLIGPIEDLVQKGLIGRPISETVGMFEDGFDDSDHDKKNTSCKITQTGILYFENKKDNHNSRSLAFSALVISFIGLIDMSIINFFKGIFE